MVVNSVCVGLGGLVGVTKMVCMLPRTEVMIGDAVGDHVGDGVWYGVEGDRTGEGGDGDEDGDGVVSWTS